jgi:hypothetical protein
MPGRLGKLTSLDRRLAQRQDVGVFYFIFRFLL